MTLRTYTLCAALLAHAAYPGYGKQPAQHSLDTCDAVATYAEASGLPVELAVSTAYYESKLNMHARNPSSSARGPMQILRPWCKHGDCDTVDGTLRASMYALWWHLRRKGWDWRQGSVDYVGVSVAIDKDRAAAHAAKIYRTAIWLDEQRACQCSRGSL